MSHTSTSIVRLALSLSMVAVGACGDSESNPTGSGGGDSGTGGGGTTTTDGSGGAGGSTSTAQGTGGSGGAATDPVLGTTQSGDCGTAQDFADACEEEGGLLADGCQDTGCGGPGWKATCYEPPPEPGAEAFACDGLFNCTVGEFCKSVSPSPDGCYSHACEPFPAECSDDPTCACLLAQPAFVGSTCDEDADGNPTLRTNE